MTTPAKLVTTTASSDLKKYEDMDVDQLLSQLSAEEIQMLAKEVDPDVSGTRINCFVLMTSLFEYLLWKRRIHPSIRVSALTLCERYVKVLHLLLQ